MYKKLIKSLAVLGSVGVLATPLAQAKDSETVRISSVFDVSGEQNIAGQSMLHALQMAIAELNAKGGVLGKQIDFNFYDSGNSQSKYMQYANRIAMNDKPDVTISGINSASREAIRPIFKRNDILYFYPELYEGGVCDRNMISTNAVPSQTTAALVPWILNEHNAKTVYIVGADYNFGRISAQWAKNYAEEHGAEVLAERFVPLDSSNFKSIIDDIQAKKPDVVLSFTVGTNHTSFYRDFAAAGLKESIPIGSTTFGLSNESKILNASESTGIASAFNYFDSDESAVSKEFLEKWNQAEGGGEIPITSTGVGAWYSVMAWAQAVEKAGTTDREKVLDIIEQGDISVEGPAGVITIDPKSHHSIGSISIGVLDDSGKFILVETQEGVEPAYEMEVCDLLANPDTNKQFTP